VRNIAIILFGRPFVKRFALCYRSLVCPVCLSFRDVRALWPNGWTDQDETWDAGTPRPWTHCVTWGPSSSHPKGHSPPIFGPYLLRPNGCMDQDVTWYGATFRPRPLCVRMGPRSPPQKGAEPQPIFGPRLLWPNGCMDQDATWYGGRPRPTRHRVRCGPSNPGKKGTPTPTQFLAHVYCGHMAGWMKTPLFGTDVELGPGHIVLDWSQLPRKGHSSPLYSAHVYCGHGRPSQLLLSSCLRLSVRMHIS